MAISRLFHLTGTLMVLAVPAAAQAAPTCRESAARATSGVPSEDDLAVLLTCASYRGPAYAAYLKRLGSARDTVRLQVPFGDANLLRDAAVFDALHQLAGDPAATAETRVYSLIALVYHEAGSTALTYREITSVPKGGTCGVAALDDVERSVIRGTPLPADHRRRTRALATRLDSDPATPPPVQSAARCLLAAIGGSGVDEAAAIDAGPVNWDGIELAYVCNDLFRARNSNLRDVPVNYDVEGTAVRGQLVLPRNPHVEGGYSEITFAIAQAGTVRLLRDGVVLKTASNQRTRCSPGG